MNEQERKRVDEIRATIQGDCRAFMRVTDVSFLLDLVKRQQEKIAFQKSYIEEFIELACEHDCPLPADRIPSDNEATP